MIERDYTLETLLDLNGEIYVLNNRGYWVKFEVRRIGEPGHSQNRPHGIKYSLTLHDRHGKRIIGYDNAHKIPGKPEDTAYDHKHHVRYGKSVREYKFIDSSQLLKDFWDDVGDYLNEE